MGVSARGALISAGGNALVADADRDFGIAGTGAQDRLAGSPTEPAAKSVMKPKPPFDGPIAASLIAGTFSRVPNAASVATLCRDPSCNRATILASAILGRIDPELTVAVAARSKKV
jgi:hypothetical protein